MARTCIKPSALLATTALLLLGSCLFLLPGAQAHGYLSQPPSRNYVSRFIVQDWHTDTPHGGNGNGRAVGSGWSGSGIPDMSGGPFQVGKGDDRKLLPQPPSPAA
jgi:hypothetical protein